jgi:transcriptional regulator with XRE-family HTH domain
MENLSSRGREIAQRILRLRRDGEGCAEFARRIGLSPQMVSNYRSGLHGASVEAVSAVCTAAPVNAHWLITGTGPIERAEGDGISAYGAGVRDTTDRIAATVSEIRLQHGLAGTEGGAPSIRDEPSPGVEMSADD